MAYGAWGLVSMDLHRRALCIYHFITCAVRTSVDLLFWVYVCVCVFFSLDVLFRFSCFRSLYRMHFYSQDFSTNFSFLPVCAPPNSITAHVTSMHLHSLCMKARAPIAVALLLLLVSLFNSVWNVPGKKILLLLFAMKMMLANDFLITLCACILARFTRRRMRKEKKKRESVKDFWYAENIFASTI